MTTRICEDDGTYREVKSGSYCLLEIKSSRQKSHRWWDYIVFSQSMTHKKYIHRFLRFYARNKHTIIVGALWDELTIFD